MVWDIGSKVTCLGALGAGSKRGEHIQVGVEDLWRIVDHVMPGYVLHELQAEHTIIHARHLYSSIDMGS